MTNPHLILYVFATVFFVLAAFPNVTSRPVRLEWLGVACLVLTLIV